ncbi:hypothetical protein LCH33_002956 [Pseudomonas amygdali]|jgi:predicted RNase H-like nuclease (RuvC/YqgF family)|uniref:Uncharacterized protein n=1 Tax=Pseudomonas amygdali pv. hibisci TaxID=251723 RepID=A0AB34UIU6_PSEA0|nr:hypothetical protein [Pseudomonas amygdali]KPX59443.1 Uncharacterized protein ALO67_03497 [Pseudomonas amygdali pv. hibisci]RMN59521.1 hypothetical protein ALQ57_02754 [Pseudomonas amygdali pv. hibisci]UBT79559.1 hypothetical protein LCH33_002956 [Pseudomonas amygdali]
MNIDYAEDWPFCPTEEQMLKQHAHLVVEENRLLRDEVDRYRKHVTKLIDMHNDAALERDKLRIKLRDADNRISDLLREACESWKQSNSLEQVIEQHRLLLRNANVDPVMWGDGRIQVPKGSGT